MKNIDKYIEEIKELERLAKLEADPQEEIDNDEEVVRNLLSANGVYVNSIYDLVNSECNYPEVIPILLTKLTDNLISTSKICEGVIRSLICKESRGIVESDLLKYYHKLKGHKKTGVVGWVIGDAIFELYNPKSPAISVDELFDIIIDKSNGKSRQMFVSTLAKMRNIGGEKEKALIPLINDEDIDAQVIGVLMKFKTSAALPNLKKKLKTVNNKVFKSNIELAISEIES